jgi:hypothetical protein
MAASRPPIVSVLVTARDNERHVRSTIESVLRQSLADLELLIVDDGSRDSTAYLLSQLDDERVAVTVHTESAGIPTRRNELLERARGRYIAPLDADDIWFSDRLARQVAVLEAQPSLAVVGSDVMVVDDAVGIGLYFRVPRSDAAIRWWSLFSSPVIHISSTIRATAFETGIRYDPSFPLAQDYDLFTKLLRHGRAANLDVPLSLYRVHPQQASQRRRDERVREQQTIALRTIEEVVGLSGDRARRAWALGACEPIDGRLGESVDAYRELFERFCDRHRGARGMGEVRRLAATALLRRSRATGRRRQLWRAALAIDPGAPVGAVAVRLANVASARRHRRAAEELVSGLAG